MIELPLCQWRRDENGEERELSPGFWPCRSPNLVKPDTGVAADFCARRCPYVNQPAKAKATRAAPKYRGQCPELGPSLPGQERTSCGAKKRQCALHDVCTTLVVCDDLPCCETCPDHPEAKP